MSVCSAPSQGLWCAVYNVDKRLFLWLGTEGRSRLYFFMLTATSVSIHSARAEREEEPGFSVGEGWWHHPQQEVVAAGQRDNAGRPPLASSVLVNSIFCPCFLCAVLLQSCLCKAFNKYPLKHGGDEQSNVKNNEMSLSLRGSSIDQPWRELIMRHTLPRENSNSLPLCSPPSPSLQIVFAQENDLCRKGARQQVRTGGAGVGERRKDRGRAKGQMWLPKVSDKDCCVKCPSGACQDPRGRRLWE